MQALRTNRGPEAGRHETPSRGECMRFPAIVIAHNGQQSSEKM